MKKILNLERGENAVSETVGFIIIFGIMMSGIALVTLYGYPALLDAQQNANIRNMERNMISLQSDVNSLTYKAVPYKETTMQVSGGVLSVKKPDDAKWLSIKVDGSDLLDIFAIDPAMKNKFQQGSLTFTSESGLPIISLQNGAVVKRELGGSVMLSEPRWFFDEASNTLVITLIRVNSTPVLAKSGISTVRMEIVPYPIKDSENIIDENTTAKTVSITNRDEESDYYRGWKNYFENTLKMTEVAALPPGSPPTWQRTDINRVIIKAWEITILNL